MSAREDLIAALAHRQPRGAVPVWELEFHAWDAASGRHMMLGREFEKLTTAEQDRALHTNAEIMVSVSTAMHYSMLTSPGGYWYQAPGELAYFVLPGEHRLKQFEILRQTAGDSLALIANSGGVMAGSYTEDFCEKLFFAPEELDQTAKATLDSGLQAARRFRDLGADAVFSASDIADNSGPFFNPAQMDRFILPYLDRWASEVKAMGMFSILHSDGQLTPYLEKLADTPLDALQAIDPVAGMDMLKARELVKDRLCLCGNVDCGLLVRGRPQEVFEGTRQLLVTCKAGGGLMLGASNAVQKDVPMENYRAMIQAWEQFGGYA